MEFLRAGRKDEGTDEGDSTFLRGRLYCYFTDKPVTMLVMLKNQSNVPAMGGKEDY